MRSERGGGGERGEPAGLEGGGSVGPWKMSGNGKKVPDMAVKAGKAIDCDGMLVTEEARTEFATLRRSFEDVNHQL